jgi:hypothetical protein
MGENFNNQSAGYGLGAEPEAPGDPRDSIIGTRLRDAWRQERRYFNRRGFCHVLMWVVANVLLDLVVDQLFEPPLIGRVFLLLANFLTVAWVVQRQWLSYLRPFDAARVALQVESRHPDLQSLLVSYVQVHEAGLPESEASPQLVAAMERQAVERSEPLDFRDFVDLGELWKITLFAAFVLILFFGVSVFQSDALPILARRMIGSNERYPRKTIIDNPVQVQNGGVVKQGESLRIVARVRGVIPESGQLEWTVAGEKQPTLPFPKTADGIERDDPSVFAYTFESVHESFDFALRIGDDRSVNYRVKVVPKPRLKEVKLTLHYPAYTRERDKDSDTLSLGVLESALLEWRLTFHEPVRYVELTPGLERVEAMEESKLPKPIIEFLKAKHAKDKRGAIRSRTRGDAVHYEIELTSDAGRTVLRLNANGKPHVDTGVFAPLRLRPGDDGSVTFVRSALERFQYRFRWAHVEHESFVYDEGVDHQVRILHDQPPEVEILDPLADGKGTRKKKLVIGYRASDDYGIRLSEDKSKPQGWLVFWVREGAERRAPVPLKEGVGKLQDWNPGLSAPDLKPGDVVSFALEVADNFTPPHVVRSEVRRFAILSDAEYRRQMQQALSDLVDEVKGVHESESEAVRQVGLLKTTSEPDKKPEPKKPEPKKPE